MLIASAVLSAGCGKTDAQGSGSGDVSGRTWIDVGPVDAGWSSSHDAGPLPGIDLAGRWALVGFIDPVGVMLVQSGAALSGRGCVAGTPPVEEELPGLCGAIGGDIDGRSVRFSFSFSGGGSLGKGTYAFRGTSSADGRRMTGMVLGDNDGVPVPSGPRHAWLRVADGEPGLPPSAGDAGALRFKGVYVLRLTSARGAHYQAGRDYALYLGPQGLQGDFGVFGSSEIGEPAPDGSVTVGPVPPTELDLATSLRLVARGGALSEVEATLPADERYVFSAAPCPGGFVLGQCRSP